MPTAYYAPVQRDETNVWFVAPFWSSDGAYVPRESWMGDTHASRREAEIEQRERLALLERLGWTCEYPKR